MAAYQFPPDLEDEIKQRMKTGQYKSQDELLREALRALKSRDAEVAAIQEGIDDMEAGRMRPIGDVADDIRQKQGWTSDA